MLDLVNHFKGIKKVT